MNDKIDWNFILSDTRGRVYLLWAILAPWGFVATHYFQQMGILFVWLAISVVGLGYMYRVMPLRVRQMQLIFAAWLVPIASGMLVSLLVFYNHALAELLLVRLGAFWLLVMAAGYIWNGLVDPPSGWYWFAAAVNVVAGVVCWTVEPFTTAQYLIAAIVSAWSMLSLWLFRTF